MSGRHRRVASRSARGRHRRPPQRARLVVPVVGAVAVLGIGGVSAAAALSGGGSDHAAPARTAARSTASPHPASRTSPSPVAAATPTRTTSPPGRPAPPDFAVTVVGRVSWVEIDGPNGRVLYLGMLRHGHTLAFSQRPLQVTLGDAGAVRLVLHHHVHARAGRPGTVLHFTVR